MRKLIFYPNLSLGGVTSVIRGRAANEPDTVFDLLFFYDRGGHLAFNEFPNVNVRICDPTRIPAYLNSLLADFTYDEISVLSAPEIANIVSEDSDRLVSYEFHSSDMSVIARELDTLNIEHLGRITAPSQTMVTKIAGLVEPRYRLRIQEVPNLVDTSVFQYSGSKDFTKAFANLGPNTIPLIWVGRFDKGKGFRYFLRLLSTLPPEFTGFVVVSLEQDPSRPSDFLSEAEAMGVSSRIQMFSNLERSVVADLYRSARDMGGWYVSTSLMESFGYAVAEALTCGLRVAAFSLPPFESFRELGRLETVPIGSVRELSKVLIDG